ncbi:hypothetical protein D3C72_1832430 [compost metagenome]
MAGIHPHIRADKAAAVIGHFILPTGFGTQAQTDNDVVDLVNQRLDLPHSPVAQLTARRAILVERVHRLGLGVGHFGLLQSGPGSADGMFLGQ